MLEKVFHHKLLKEGERGQGVITERRDQGAERSSSHYSTLFEVKGHIQFPDGTQTEFSSEMLNSSKVGSLQEGAIVPVRYDATDHSKVVLDIPALEEQEKAKREHDLSWLEQEKARRIADADAQTAQANQPNLPQ
jgi:hypothetical protein